MVIHSAHSNCDLYSNLKNLYVCKFNGNFYFFIYTSLKFYSIEVKEKKNPSFIY